MLKSKPKPEFIVIHTKHEKRIIGDYILHTDYSHLKNTSVKINGRGYFFIFAVYRIIQRRITA